MVFKKKKPSKEELQQQETATVSDKQEKPEDITQGKLLVEMTEPERFTLLYGELATIRQLLEELITIAKEE